MQVLCFNQRCFKMGLQLSKPICPGQGQSHLQLHDYHGDAVIFVLCRQRDDFWIGWGSVAKAHERAVNPSK